MNEGISSEETMDIITKELATEEKKIIRIDKVKKKN